MNLRFFIDRPVFSGVISVVIVLMGVIAMKALPVEQYRVSGFSWLVSFLLSV